MHGLVRFAALWVTHRWCFLPNFRGKWFVRERLVRLCRRLEAHAQSRPFRLRSGIVIDLDIEMGTPRSILTDWVGEASTVAALDRSLRPGDVVVDIGANIGYFSLLCAARVFPAGRVYAFEPGARAWAHLTRNLGLNEVGKIVTPQQTAIGRETGRGHLRQSRPGDEDMAVLEDRVDPAGAYEDVAVTTVDEALSEVDRPIRLLKVDVEGREWDVLKGAERRLASDRPVLFVELSSSQQKRFGHEPTELADWIKGRGYSLQTIERDLAPFLPTHLDTVAYLNVLASPLQR
jgi:FkbM family methyltransferase